MLPEDDKAFLVARGLRFELTPENGFVHVVLKEFEFPNAYAPRQADMLLRLPTGYPNAKPDMFWTRPDVLLASGTWPVASEVKESYLGVTWQRWSRHWPYKWRPGVDCLETFLASIQKELSRGR